jgi:hypothetical protein
MCRIVQMRFIHHLEALGREGVVELSFDRVNCPHPVRLGENKLSGNAGHALERIAHKSA